jgi:CRISPR/Cas system-associated exonuclease Cas4 (RecB family)
MTAEEVDSAPVTLVSDARTPTVDLYLSAAEYDLGQLEQARMLNAPIPSYLSATEGGASFGRFLDQQRDRWSMRFGEHDGVVGTGEDLLTRLRERRISPTAIEDFSVCPYRVFASRLLGLDKIDEPEELEEISPLESGSLVHGILEDAIAGWQEARLAPGWIEANLDRIADARFRDAEERGVTGLEGMWRRTRVALMRDLRRYLREQLASGLGTAWRPVMPEAGFGMSDGEWPAIEVGGAEKLPMRGKIDRVDLSADGTQVRVIDYKTGRAKSAKLEHGKAFQLPVYLLAALENLGTTEGMAEYHFMTRRGQFKVERFDSDQLREQRGEIEQTIDLVVDHAREGLFPPWPADGKNCRFCNFNRVCGDQLSRRVSRKWEADGRLARYRFIHHGEDGGDDLGAPPSDGDES